jgi:uncharacterized membrane protein
MTQLWWWRSVHGPSAWTQRAPVVVLAFAGAVVSTYLAMYQYHLIDAVWDPLFDVGSEQVLTSAFSRSLPVHDAALGVAAYLVEIILELAGSSRRWRDAPWLVLLLGLTAAAMAATALALLAIQALVVHAFCTLCLASAAISLTVPLLVFDEVVAALRQIRRGRRIGLPLWWALRGRAAHR